MHTSHSYYFLFFCIFYWPLLCRVAQGWVGEVGWLVLTLADGGTLVSSCCGVSAWNHCLWDGCSVLGSLPFFFLSKLVLWFGAAATKLLQSCPTLCDPIDGNPPGSPIPGILQARTLEWVAISFSNAWKWKVKGKSLSRVRLFATPWTAAHQTPPSMGFSRQEC